jgi:hypothetical protein
MKNQLNENDNDKKMIYLSDYLPKFTFMSLKYAKYVKNDNNEKNMNKIVNVSRNSVKHFPILTFFSMIFNPSFRIFNIQHETPVLFPYFIHKHKIINPFSKLF